MEQFERPGDSLQEIRLIPLWRLILGPGDAANLGHRREAIVHNRRIAVGLPRITPGPVDANPSLARGVFARHVVLIVSPRRLDRAHAISFESVVSPDRKSTRLNSSHLGISYA